MKKKVNWMITLCMLEIFKIKGKILITNYTNKILIKGELEKKVTWMITLSQTNNKLYSLIQIKGKI